jgi:hypothetical protein
MIVGGFTVQGPEFQILYVIRVDVASVTSLDNEARCSLPSGRIRGEVFCDTLSLSLLSIQAYRRAVILRRLLFLS